MWFRKKPVKIWAEKCLAETVISTKEGDMKARLGDMIITGVQGEKYPCKPDIFEATYEPCEGAAADFSFSLTESEVNFLARMLRTIQEKSFGLNKEVEKSLEKIRYRLVSESSEFFTSQKGS
jgi:hypothetical protein